MIKKILQDVTRRRCSILIYFVIGEIIVGILLYLTIRSHVTKKPIMKSNEDYNYKERPEVSFYKYYKIKNKSPDSTVSVNVPLFCGEETFFLNGLSLTIISGAIHYFRVHPAYWRDRLKKLRAMGANTVETYIPWNLHEPEKDCYDFGKSVSGTDYPFSEWLDVVKFLEMAKEEDLFVIIRPGPYICSEWDFGGLPSYLLSIPDIQIRTNDPKYLERVDKYFNQLIPRLAPLQIKDGGPIIMVQIENEYGHFAQNGGKDHLKHLKIKMQEGGLDGYFVTSDGIQMVGAAGSLIEDEVLMTANLKEAITEQLTELKEIQPFRPAMVMEFWTGWFDHWGKPHSRCNASSYINRLMEILDFPASVNLYMFHGGTNFGFMNGANQFLVNNEILYAPDTTSYDYDALLTENGDYTEKYNLTRNLLVQEEMGLDIRIYSLPPHIPTTAYKPTKILYQLDWNKIVENVWKEDMVDSDVLLPMELLPLPARNGKGERGGQSYGFALYRSTFSKLTNPEIQIMGRVRDMATILVDGVRQTELFKNIGQIYNFGFWGAVDKKMTLHADEGTHEIDILVENLGRNNYGFTFEDFDTRKGLLTDSVKINDEVMKGPWSIMALDFQPNWIKRLKGWKPYTEKSVDVLDSPTMYRTNLYLEKGEIFDTFLVMEDWGKGVVFVNNFNIGRYFNIGSQLALYIPAPLLQPGDNTVIIFELFSHKGEITFSSKPLYKN